jgi:hypothetical protein
VDVVILPGVAGPQVEDAVVGGVAEPAVDVVAAVVV